MLLRFTFFLYIFTSSLIIDNFLFIFFLHASTHCFLRKIFFPLHEILTKKNYLLFLHHHSQMDIINLCNKKKDCIFHVLNASSSRFKNKFLCDNLTCKRSNNLLMLMLSCYVSTNGVVACKCSRAEGTWYTNTLMTLSNVSS